MVGRAAGAPWCRKKLARPTIPREWTRNSGCHAPFAETARYATVLVPGGASLLRVGPQGPASLLQFAALGLLGEMKLAATTEAGRESPVNGADWKSGTSSWRNVRVVVRDSAWVSERRVKIHDGVSVASLIKVKDMDSVPAPPVRLQAIDEPGTGVRVSSRGRTEMLDYFLYEVSYFMR